MTSFDIDMGRRGQRAAGGAAWTLSRLVNTTFSGDSLTQSGHKPTATGEQLLIEGYAGWLMGSNLGWNYRVGNDFGKGGSYAVGGYTLEQIESVIESDAATTPANNGFIAYGVRQNQVGVAAGAGLEQADIVFALPGTNNLLNDSLATMQAKAATLADAFETIGDARILWGQIIPNLGVVAQNQKRLDFNAWVASTLVPARTRFKTWNADAVLDPSSTGGMLAAYRYDNTHTNSVGAKVLADHVFSLMGGLDMLPAPVVFPVALNAASDPTNVLRHLGADNSNDYKLLGTTGTKTQVTGNVATGWTATANVAWTTSAGAQPVASKEVISGNLEKQVFTFPTGTTPSTLANRYLTFASRNIATARAAGAGLQVDKAYRSGIRVETVGLKNCLHIQVQAAWQLSGANRIHYASSALDLAGSMVPENGAWDLVVPQVYIPGGTTTIQLTNVNVLIGFDPNAVSGGAVKLSRPYLREHVFLASWP